MDTSLPSLMDPATGQPLPPDAIVRILHITPKVHVYAIPPNTLPSLTSGYQASTWTALPNNPIFTARLRVLETSTDSSESAAESSTNVKVDIILEHPTEGTLFAAAPYTTQAIVTPCSDSSRFFALRVQDPATKSKATLGVGFEERSEAFDFGVVLQESAKHLFPHELGGGNIPKKAEVKEKDEEKRDLGLKEGETITVNLGGTKFGRRVRAASGSAGQKEEGQGGGKGDEDKPLNSFALAPPPSLNSFALPPPPGAGPAAGTGAREARAQKRLSAQQMGFDDGQFGEFA